jgi:hypothetical protein
MRAHGQSIGREIDRRGVANCRFSQFYDRYFLETGFLREKHRTAIRGKKKVKIKK